MWDIVLEVSGDSRADVIEASFYVKFITLKR